MNLAEYKSTNPVLKRGCVCFLLNEDNILLTMKKRGFGVGKWNGYGGKCEPDETFEQCAIREAQEEISVEPTNLEFAGTLKFYSEESGSNWEIAIFLVRSWNGLPDESEEVRPEWFSINDIPYEEMWQDDKFWLPRVLSGEKITGDFLFDAHDNLIEHSIIPA